MIDTLNSTDQKIGPEGGDEQTLAIYRIRFREHGQEFSATSLVGDLSRGDKVMVQTVHGQEPAIVLSCCILADGLPKPPLLHILRTLDEEEQEQYLSLPQLEQEAFVLCTQQIDRLQLFMNLVRVERFFNGSKIIFYFTAENRVDFRELVKVLVREFCTRVEMRQIGVRHETQMLGGLGPCGRELCCTAFLDHFDSVSIKMAKAQDLSLNPAKISGLCNRLLCCLTYEYENYRNTKKGMPKIGKIFLFEGKNYQIVRQIPLSGKVLGVSSEGEERLFAEEDWRIMEAGPKSGPRNKPQGKKGGNRQAADSNRSGEQKKSGPG